MMSKLKTWIPTLVLILLVVPFVVMAAPFLIGGNQALVVLSGSMEPAMSTGDMVVTEPVDPAAIHEGDIITYERGRELVTHRVVDRVQDPGMAFRTKGDANEDPDQYLVDESQVRGRVMLIVPYYGYVVHKLGQGIIPLLLIIVPAALIVVNEVLKLRRTFGEERDEAGA